MIQKEHAGKLLASNIVLMSIAKHSPKQNNLSKQSTRTGKGMEINNQNSNLGKTGASYDLCYPP